MKPLSKIDKQALIEWQRKAEDIRKTTEYIPEEDEAVRNKRLAVLKKDYNQFVKYYFPRFADADCAPFHIDAAKAILKNPDISAVLEWPREHAKSVHSNIIIPMFLKVHGQLKGMILVGKNESDACTLIGDLQAELMENQRYIADYGEQYRHGSWEEGKFITADNIMFKALGRGQSPRGSRNGEKRPNYVVCDDIDDDQIVNNPKRVKQVVNWILTAILPLNNKDGLRLVMAGNRIHRRSILATFVGDVEPGDPKREGIWHSKIFAIDPKTGRPAWEARYTLALLQAKFKRMGNAAARQEFFHEHSMEGTVFKEQWLQWKELPEVKLSKYDHLVVYCDPSWSDTGDTKACALIGRLGRETHIIKAFCRRCTVSEMYRWLYDTYDYLRKNNAVAEFWIEGNFNQGMHLRDIEEEGDKRGYQLPIRTDKRKKPDKYARIQTLVPFFERSLMFFNLKEKASQDFQEGKDQITGFEQGRTCNDDFPDMLEGGMYYLEQRSRVSKSVRILGERPSRQY